MPFIANTPESLLGRSDSKNPDTTCRGITSSGRPCRRSLSAGSPSPSPSASPQPPRGRVDKLRADGSTPSVKLTPPDEQGDFDGLCWQHRDQVDISNNTTPTPNEKKKIRPILEARESTDTLIDRLGITDEEQKKKKQPKTDKKAEQKINQRIEPPKNGRKSGRSSPRSSNEKLDVNGGGSGVSSASSSPLQKPRTSREEVFCLCFRIPVLGEEGEEDEKQPRPRPQPQPVQSAHRPTTTTTTTTKTTTTTTTATMTSTNSRPGNTSAQPAQSSQTSKKPSKSTSSITGPRTSRPNLVSDEPASSAKLLSPAPSGSTQLSQYMSLIPANASPQTASQLMTELAKPYSQQDEPGYIYIFWLTPESDPATPAAEAAAELLAPPSRPTTKQRRPSDVLESFATKSSKAKAKADAPGASKDANKKTVLLKIGRASNVQRRLNEWTRQCGYNISLIRYYPYVKSSSSSGQSETPRKVPHSHKVERLIHIELAGLDLRVSDRENCESCGRAHREWFEVEATRKGIVAVDEIVKRWSDWDEAGG